MFNIEQIKKGLEAEKLSDATRVQIEMMCGHYELLNERIEAEIKSLKILGFKVAGTDKKITGINYNLKEIEIN